MSQLLWALEQARHKSGILLQSMCRGRLVLSVSGAEQQRWGTGESFCWEVGEMWYWEEVGGWKSWISCQPANRAPFLPALCQDSAPDVHQTLHPSDLRWVLAGPSLGRPCWSVFCTLPLFFLPVSCEAFREVVCVKDSA